MRLSRSAKRDDECSCVSGWDDRGPPMETFRSETSATILPAFGIRAAAGLMLMLMLAPTLLVPVGKVLSVPAEALEPRRLSIRLLP